jgi:hypothetical protein
MDRRKKPAGGPAADEGVRPTRLRGIFDGISTSQAIGLRHNVASI